MKIGLVPPEHASAVLCSVEGQFLEAMAQGQADAVTPRDALLEFSEGKSELWAVHDEEGVHAAVGVSVSQFPACRKVWVNLLAGRRMFEWADLVESALEKCRSLTESKCVEASCRPDLARYLERRGWTMKAIIMEAPR